MRRALAACASLLLVAAGSSKTSDALDDIKEPPGVVLMSGTQQTTVKLKIEPVRTRAITEPVRVPGTVAFDQDHVAVLHPLAQAQVTRLLVQPGDKVRAGQALAELLMPSLANTEMSLAVARAAEREARTGVAVAADALRRGEILARDGSLSRAEAEQRRLALAQANAKAEAARASAAALKAEVARLDPGDSPGVARLVTPIAGVVVTVGVTPGELVNTAGGAFTVADLSVVQVLARVPEAQVPLVAVGEPATVEIGAGGADSGPDGGSGRTWEGDVVGLGAQVDPATRTLAARIRLANEDFALRGGMAVTVTLTSSRGRDDVTVPAGAVQMVGDKRVAFTALGGDLFKAHELTLGVQRPDWVEVRKGLSVGDPVVTTGSFELKALLQKAMLKDGG